MFGLFFNIIHERVKMFQGTVMQNMKIGKTVSLDIRSEKFL